MADAITECIRVLVDRGMTRLDELEVLLCLAGDAVKAGSVGSIVADTSMGEARVRVALDGLARAGFLLQTLGKPSTGGYRLARCLDVGALQALRATFARDRTRVINTFLACNLENLRSLARDLRLRKWG
jgi:hypothetical protein